MHWKDIMMSHTPSIDHSDTRPWVSLVKMATAEASQASPPMVRTSSRPQRLHANALEYLKSETGNTDV